MNLECWLHAEWSAEHVRWLIVLGGPFHVLFEARSGPFSTFGCQKRGCPVGGARARTTDHFAPFSRPILVHSARFAVMVGLPRWNHHSFLVLNPKTDAN